MMYSIHRGRFACRLRQKFLQKRVLARDQLFRVPAEDKPALMKDKEAGERVGLAVRQRSHFTLFVVKTMGSHRERILKAMRDQQRRRAIYVTLLDNQVVDRCAGHRIKAASRRVVKQ